MTLPSRGLGRWLTLRGVTERVTGAAILDLKSWGPPSWCRGGRHLGPEVTSKTLKCHTYYPELSGLRVTSTFNQSAMSHCKFGNFRENFIFANIVKDIFATLKFATMTWCIYISNQHNYFAKSRGFYFHETSHMRSFVKIKPSRKFRIYSNNTNIMSVHPVRAHISLVRVFAVHSVGTFCS